MRSTNIYKLFQIRLNSPQLICDVNAPNQYTEFFPHSYRTVLTIEKEKVEMIKEKKWRIWRV